MGNARDKKDRDVDFNGKRAYGPAHPLVGPDLVRLDDIATGAGFVTVNQAAGPTTGATFGVSTALQTIQANGSAVTQRSTLNFSTSFAVIDNAGAVRTDVALANVGPGAGTIGSSILGFVQTITLNAFGQVTAVTTSSAYQSIQANNVAQNKRGNLNFTTSFAITDNPGGNQTSVAFATVGPGAGTIGGGGLVVASVTLNAFGQVTAASTSQAFYQFVDDAGGATSQQPRLNVLRPLVATADAFAFRTNLSLATTGPGAGVIGGAGLSIQSITLDVYGRVTAASTVAISDPAASFWTSKAESSLSAEVNIGALTTGLLKISVTGGVATPSTAVAGTDYENALTFSTGLTRATNTITNDVVTGIASTTPAWRGSTSAGGALTISASTVSPGQLRLVAGNYALGGIGTGLLKTTSDVVGLATVGVDYVANAYQTIQANGSALAQQSILNFSASFAPANDVPGTRTNVALATVGPGAGTIGTVFGFIQTITLNAFGQVVSATTGSAYQNIQANGVAQFQRGNLNFSSSFAITDSPGSNQTTVSLANVGPGPGTVGSINISAITLNASGQVTAVTSSPLYYQFVDDAGAGTSQQSRLNILRPLVATADPSNFRTNLSLGATGPGAGVIGGAGLAIQSVTLDAYGRVTAAATTTIQPAITAANGSVLYMAAGAVTGTPASLYYDPTQFGVVAYSYDFSQRALVYAGTAPRGINISGGAHTNMPTAEVVDVNVNLARTVSFVAGNITTMRAMLVTAPTYAFATGSTITTAATLAVSGAPVAGANATITNPLAFWVQAGATQLDGGLRTFGITGTGTLVALAVSQAANNVSTGGTAKGIGTSFTFAPTSGTAGFNAMDVSYAVNQTGGANGAVRGILVNATPTSVLGTHRLLELQLNGSPRFYIDAASGNIATTIASGLVKSVGGTLSTAILGTDVEAFLAFNNGLTRTANTITNDVFTGHAGAFVTWTGSTSAGGNLQIYAAQNSPTDGYIDFEAGSTNNVASFLFQSLGSFVGTAGTQSLLYTHGSFAPTAGNANFRALDLQWTINQTGTANGLMEGVSIRPTVTATNGLFYPINYCPGGTSSWRVELTGKQWMNQAGVSARGDIGMSSLGRPKFFHSLGGSQPVAATNDPLFVFKFSGAFNGSSAYGTFSEQSFGDIGFGATPGTSAVPAPTSYVPLSSNTDTWAAHSAYSIYATRYEYVLDIQPMPTKTLKLRSLVVNVIAAIGATGTTGDLCWSIYKVSAGASTATLTEVARAGTFFSVTLPWTNAGSTFFQDGQNISPSTTWTHGDRFMLTCRSLSAPSGTTGVIFTAVARFDVAED